MKWYRFKDKKPEPHKEVLVYQPWGHSGFKVLYYEPPRENYAYGWYPGGCQTVHTWWAELPEPPEKPFT